MISIVIPVYNQEKYLKRCLQSIVNQTYKEFEVIIVDDGSTDNSKFCVQSFLFDSRFTLISTVNQGVSVARNIGLSQCRGEWICFIDPDDYILPSFLQNLYDVAFSTEGADIIASSCSALSSDGLIQEQHFFPKPFIAVSEYDKIPIIHQLMDGEYMQNKGAITAIGVPWGKLYRRELLKKNNITFDPELRRMQDNIFNMVAIMKCKKFIYTDFVDYVYNSQNLKSRFYKKLISGMYHPLLWKRMILMDNFNLYSVHELYRACEEERVGLLFQEFKGQYLLSKHASIGDMTLADKHTCGLRGTISRRMIGMRFRIRLFLMNHPYLALLFFKISERKTRNF